MGVRQTTQGLLPRSHLHGGPFHGRPAYKQGMLLMLRKVAAVGFMESRSPGYYRMLDRVDLENRTEVASSTAQGYINVW